MMTRQLYTCVCVLLAVSAGLAQFTEPPASSYSVTEGMALTIPCRADNVVYYIWKINGDVITESMSGFTIDSDSLTIHSANHLVHAAMYSCTVVLDSSDSSTATFNVSVDYIGPDIAIQRTHQDCVPDIGIGYINGSLTLECLAPEGDPMVNVTWYRYSSKIRRSDIIDFSNSGRVMRISPLSTAHSGEYRCEAANNVNRDNPLQSEVLNVMVKFPEYHDISISITNGSQPLLVGPGLSAVIVCKIVPAVDVNTVQWLLNNDYLPPNSDENIRFPQRGHDELNCLNRLVLENVTEAYEGIYECRLANTLPSVPAQRELDLASLRGPLVVEATPSSLVGRAPGRRVRLVCRLDDATQPDLNNIPQQSYSYAWTHNGSSILDHAEVQDGGRELLITAADLDASGRYQCDVNSPQYNVVTTISAHVNIIVEVSPAISISVLEPEFHQQEGNKVSVELGAKVVLQCGISSPRTSTFTWSPTSQVDVVSPHVSPPSPPSSRLTLPHITALQLTSYSCQINDSVHTLQTASLQLVETQRHYIRDAAAGIQGAEFVNGSTLQLTCESRMGPASDVRWYVGGTQLTSEGTGSMTIIASGNNSTLTKYGVTISDAGQYACAVEDGGMESRLTFNVTVTVPGKIEYTSDPEVTVATGERVQFDCVTSGTPTPTIKWLYNFEPVSSLEDTDIRDLGNGSLLISSVSPDQAGTYLCFLDDVEMRREFTLTVEDKGNEEGDNGEDGLQCGSGFNQDNCTILLVGGAVAVLFLLLAFVVLLVCVCVLCRRWRNGSLTIPRELDAYEMKRALSSQASIRKDNGATPALSDSNNYVSSNSYSKGLYPTSLVVTPFDGTLLSEMQRSVTPPAPSPVLQTPGTGGTDSMFSTDDQSSLTASLPNFPRTQLRLGEELGEGEFGPVILGTARNILSHEDTTEVVVKVLVRSGDGDDHFQPDLALMDFANQMKIEYEHIACILGLCTDAEPYYVVYEYLDQGDLKKYLLTNHPVPGQPSPLSPHALSRVVLQVADGMAFLFSQRIIHGDLATRNCLISSDHHVKIADLGIGHDLYPTDYYDNGSQLLPIRWMPPELLVRTDKGPAFSLHSDIWSFGVLCWEVFMFGQLPYEGLADEEVLERVPQGQLLSPPPEVWCPPHMQAVIDQCWQLEPEGRPRFSSLCMDMNITGE